MDTTLSQALIGNRSVLSQIALIVGGSLLIGLAAQVSVPMLPVPMTLQTLAISIIALAYGSRLAAATLVAYLVEGAVGLPVFADASFGLAKLVGPTAGYLWGFVAMAWLTGYMVEHGFGRGLVRLFAAALIPAALLFVPGVIVLKLVLAMDWPSAMAAGVTPFLIGGLVKAALAALVVAGGWAAVKNRAA